MLKINREEYPLSVLNASAGSGKTHQLVLEYLSILLGDHGAKQKYKSIVAMTFTNKAAMEMKTRIIDTLDGIVHFDGSQEKIKSMINPLLELCKIDLIKLQARCAKALGEILHGYEDFHVSTIDKFNLRLIRSFSRDLDIPSDFEVILNEQQIIEEVVELLMSKLGQSGSEHLTKLMTSYAKTNLDEGESWNFKGQLVSFALILSSERNQVNVAKLMELELTDETYNELKAEIEFSEQLFIKEADETAKFFLSLNLTEDQLPGKGTSYKTIVQLSGLKEFPDNKDNKQLFTNTILKYCSEPSGKKDFPAELREKLLSLNTLFLELQPELILLKKFRSNFYNIALLQFVAEALNDLKISEQIIRISEFNKLIGSLVQDEEAPYIYERLGTRLEHFLLDEFQDTSRLQWLNLIPLVHESISNKRKNLIVGDAKQSIYRFNNGIADQFIALPEIYNPENNARLTENSKYFNALGVKQDILNNYRSASEIVNFNNALFTNLHDSLTENAQRYYASVSQTPQSKKQGFVEIISLQQEIKLEYLVDEVVVRIEKCKEDGFSFGDICILTEKNDTGNFFARALTDLKYKVVSLDSLLISGDAKVQLIVSYFKRRARPSQETEARRFAELYFRIVKKGSTEKYLSYFESIIDSSGKTKRIFKDKLFLCEHFGSEEEFYAPYENLYDLCLKFLKMMDWNETQEPYIHHFIDVVFNYQISRQADIGYFLEYYKDNKAKIALQMPEADAAIKIMTVHKSKGLEFPVVIIPKLDFSTSIHPSSKFLVEASGKLIYGNASSKSIVPEIAAFSLNELELTFLDKLNLAYVGLTRPIERLYALNYFKKKQLGSVLHLALEKMNCSTLVNGALRYLAGEEKKRENQEEKKEEFFYLPLELKDRLWYPDIVFKKQRSEEDQLEQQLFGNYFHLLMSKCETIDSLEITIENLITKGEIDSAFSGKLIATASAFFENSKKIKLFEGAIEIINEELILFTEGLSKRPDKIIVKENEIIILDFKTGKENKEHQLQLETYQTIVESMYDRKARIFIYYSEIDELKEV
jgi:ATP-dependent exoDNAse (exonuclease V) beta subunit